MGFQAALTDIIVVTVYQITRATEICSSPRVYRAMMHLSVHHLAIHPTNTKQKMDKLSNKLANRDISPQALVETKDRTNTRT